MAAIIDDFQSDSEFPVENVLQIKQKAKRRFRVWKHEKVFLNAKEAKKAIKHEIYWSYSFANKTEEDEKVYFRCNSVKFKGKQCGAGVYLLYD